MLNDAAVVERRFWDHVRAGRASTFGGVPYTYAMLQKLRFERMDLGSLRVLTQAGGKMEASATRAIAQTCQEKNIQFFSMYGQTEATARMAYLPAELALAKAGSIGQAIPGGALSLEDPDGRPIEGSQVPGELVYRGDNVSMGYANCAEDLCLPDANHGVLKTGDIAQRDADGFYYIVGRKKRFIKVFGNRIQLEAVESIVRELGYESACVGSDDHLQVYAVCQGQQAQIQDDLSRRIGIHRSAIAVHACEDLPRNASGKILYTELAQAARD